MRENESVSNLIVMKIYWCFFCILLVGGGLGWEVLSNMGDRRLGKDGYVFKNEYIFGDCKRKDKVLYETVHKTIQDIQNTAIFRDWLWYTYRIPTCIILRAASYESDTYRITKYNFEICVPRVSFCYNRRRYNYYYYEWYIPQDIAGVSAWDIYFYGPNTTDWLYLY